MVDAGYCDQYIPAEKRWIKANPVRCKDLRLYDHNTGIRNWVYDCRTVGSLDMHNSSWDGYLDMKTTECLLRLRLPKHLERVAKLLLEGYTPNDIAEIMGIVGRTVRKYRQIIRNRYCKVFNYTPPPNRRGGDHRPAAMARRQRQSDGDGGKK